MIEQPLSIKKQKPKYHSMDYDFLRDLGIRCVQQLSGSIWTDYNDHDPGVTILEQLCFAITDLGFRTDFTMQDLLNAKTVKGKNQPSNTFFDASEILPTNPLTIDDYRILIIDRVPYVKNAWFEPIRDNYLGIQGLYKVLLQIDESAQTPELIAQIKNEVLEVFSAHRNLGEDIDNIEVLSVDKIVVYADIEISSEAVAEEILANIQFKVNEYLNPSIKFHTVEELVEEGMTIDEIFDGPVPKNGFIKKSDLLPMRQEIYASKIIEIITSIEGVRRISFFSVEKNDLAIEGDDIIIDKGFYPVLDMDTLDPRFNSSNYPIQFYRGALNYDLDLQTANQLLYSQFARYKKGYEQKKLYNPRAYPSVLKREDIMQYYSIQHTFPLTYGLNPMGLPDNPNPPRERIAAIRQLRAYLLPFEQIMANYLAQLGNIKKLFSIDMEIDRTYYSQAPTDIPNYWEIFKTSSATFTDLTVTNTDSTTFEEYQKRVADEFAQKIEEVCRRFDPFIDRRNRFLDHLLARFSEQYSTDFLLKVSSSYMPLYEADKTEKELINAKIRYLRNYVDISRNRGQAFNYFEYDESQWNVSGLEKRVSLLLNILQDNKESLLRIFDKGIPQANLPAFAEVIQFIDIDAHPEGIIKEGTLEFEILNDEYANEEEKQVRSRAESLERLGIVEDELKEEPVEFDFLQDHELPQDTYSGDDNFTAPLAKDAALLFEQYFYFRASSRSELLIEILGRGVLATNYFILPDMYDNNIYHIYYRGNKAIGPYKIRTASSYAQADQLLKMLINYLHAINKYTEGFHVVEHVLLRPQAKDQHYFELLNDRDEVILMSYTLGEQNEQRYLSEDVPVMGGLKENYEIIPYYGEEEPQRVLKKSAQRDMPKAEDETWEEDKLYDDDTQAFLDKLNSLTQEETPQEVEAIPQEAAKQILEYHVVLKDTYGRYIARAARGFETQQEAKEYILDVVDYITSFTKGNISIFDRINYKVEHRIQATVEPDFYSQEISIVMPNWTTRFQNADFRYLLKNTMAVNCPVHLHVHFFWIGVEEMEDFERVYNAWLYERMAVSPRQPHLDQKAVVLTELLGAYFRITQEKRTKKRYNTQNQNTIA